MLRLDAANIFLSNLRYCQINNNSNSMAIYSHKRQATMNNCVLWR